MSRFRLLRFLSTGAILAGMLGSVAWLAQGAGAQVKQKPVSIVVGRGKEPPVAFGRILTHSAWGGNAGAVEVWLQEGNQRFALKGHDQPVLSLDWGPEDRYLATGSLDQTIRIWDITERKEFRVLTGAQSRVTGVSWHPHGNLIASCGWDSPIRIWRVATGKQERTIDGYEKGAFALAFSPDGKSIAAAPVAWEPGHGIVKIWDVATGHVIQELKGHSSHVWALAWSPDSRRLATVSSDQTLRIWDVDFGKALHVFKGHEKQIRAVSWHPLRPFVATGSFDQTVRIWDVEAGKQLETLADRKALVNSLDWDLSGKRLISGALDGTVVISRLYFHPTLAKRVQPPAPLDAVYSGVPLDTLTQYDNGAGLAMADPTLAGVSEGEVPEEQQPLANFGAGCARWLFLHVGGHGELGKTPLWVSITRALADMGKRQTRISAEEAPDFAARMGATHVAVGNIEGNDEKLTLTFRLLDSAGKPVDEPLVASGTKTEVLKALPGMAVELAERLGVKKPRVPEQVPISAEDLQFLGRVYFEPVNLREEKHVERLREIAERSNLAALFYYMHAAAHQERSEIVWAIERLAKSAPDNALIWSGVALRAKIVLEFPAFETFMETVKPNLARYPNSYLYTSAEVFFRRRFISWFKTSREAAEHSIRCATKNPEAWGNLAYYIYAHAYLLRRARFVSQIPKEEWSQLEKLYRLEVAVRKKAVEADPKFGIGWLDLSKAAANTGDAKTADEAFWQAVDLGRQQGNTFHWGLNMYSSAWFNDPEKQRKVAQLAAKANWGSEQSRFQAARMLNSYGFKEVAQGMFKTDEERKRFQEYLTAINFRRPEDDLHEKPKTDAQHAVQLAGGARAATLSWDPEGKLLAYGGQDRAVKVRSTTGEEKLHLNGHMGTVNCVAWSPDGKIIASASHDFTIRLWSATDGKLIRSLKGHQHLVHWVDWSPDGKRLASAGFDKTVRIWDLETGLELRTLRGFPSFAVEVRWSPDGKLLAASAAKGDDESSVTFIWNAKTGEKLHTLDPGVTPPKDRYTRGDFKLQATGNLAVGPFAWSADSSRIASGNNGNVIRIWDVSTGMVVKQLTGHSLKVRALAWSPDGSRLASGSSDHYLKVWDLTTGKATYSLHAHTSPVWALAWHRDGKRLASSGADGRLLLWDLEKITAEKKKPE